MSFGLISCSHALAMMVMSSALSLCFSWCISLAPSRGQSSLFITLNNVVSWSRNDLFTWWTQQFTALNNSAQRKPIPHTIYITLNHMYLYFHKNDKCSNYQWPQYLHFVAECLTIRRRCMHPCFPRNKPLAAFLLRCQHLASSSSPWPEWIWTCDENICEEVS